MHLKGGVIMGFNHSRLLGRMREFGFTQHTLSQAIRINAGTLNQKLNNKTRFTTDEIVSICELLDIPCEEISKYFFAK